MNLFKCDVCGQFIPYHDFISGDATNIMILPDSELSVETYETLCWKHSVRNKMEVLKYLQHKTLENLNEEFAIKVKEYPDYNLAVLNYNQIDSPKFHPIVRECRGLIIDTERLIPVSRTFDRFFNFNENVNDSFMWDKSFRAEEKADGSLMSVYWHQRKWRVASRGNAFAEGETGTGWSFRGLFKGIIGMDINEFMVDMFRNRSYTFEMCTIHNKVVKLYEKPCLYLLNIHELASGYNVESWILDQVAETLKVKRPEVYPIKSVDEIHESFEDFEPTEEGYVLIDQEGNRIKIKNPTYVDLHHLKGNGEITPKRITEVVFRGEIEEVLGYFPEYREFFEPWQQAYKRLLMLINAMLYLVDDENLSQKDFALSISHLHFKGVLFSMRKGLTLEEIFDKMGSNAKVQLLEKLI